MYMNSFETDLKFSHKNAITLATLKNKRIQYYLVGRQLPTLVHHGTVEVASRDELAKV